uniref:Uncharacterized protein n=1 Tax=Callorhinchus milii TaxID=7868 RepID=A0A4W3I5M0_CALMI
PGLTVYPVSGTIPAGGHAILKIDLTPTKVFKFDIRVKVEIRNSSTLKLRIGGSVEPPQADISVKYFKFPGVFLGATYTIPFTLLNLTGSRMITHFNLSDNKDFALKFEDSADSSNDPFDPHICDVNLKAKEEIKCELLFTPTEVSNLKQILSTLLFFLSFAIHE